jgi:uncharacterized protein YcgL (UPF0745 family)
MICAVYKSPKRDSTYLFVERRDDFSRVPESLMAVFGPPRFVSMLALKDRIRLATVDAEHLLQTLRAQGYYLQLPPPQENLLKQHRSQLGLEQN